MRSALSFTFRVLLLLSPGASGWSIESGLRDPEFSRVPFDKWVAGEKGDHVRWSVEVLPTELSTHQRMLTRIVLKLDGRELEKRRGRGDFVAFIQYQDSSGRVWQNHTAFNLETLQPGMQTRDVIIAHYAFVLPGDYTLALAVWHSVTGEHSLIRRRLRVGGVSNDPLPELWTGLPAVEFVPAPEIPDLWYLPDIQRLNLPVQTRRPVHVEILLNTTASTRSAGSLVALRRNMDLLVPALKALTAMRLQQGSLEVSLLDLTRRRNVFDQKNVDVLDWDRMRRFFLATNPGVVDVNTLANELKMRSYFWNEVSRRMSVRDNAAHVLIILSGAAFIGNQEVVDAPEVPADPDHRLIYIRYRPDPLRYFAQRRFRPGARPMPPPALRPMGPDDLEKTVEPMHARFFDAISAEQFRRILAAVVDEIERI